MAPSVRRSVIVGFNVAIILLVVVNVLASASIVQLLRQNEAQLQARETVQVANDLLVDVLNAETGQRGYLLTGNQAYLVPYHLARSRLEERIERLRELTSDTAEGRAELTVIEGLIGDKIAVLETTIRLRQTEGIEAALVLVNNNEGKRLMDDIRARMNALIAADQTLALEGAAIIQRLVQATLAFLVGSVVIMIGVGWFALRSVTQTLQLRAQAEASLRESRDTLDREVAARTAELREANIALRANEARYRGIVEDQTEYICRCQQDGTILFVNLAYARSRRAEAGNLVGRSLLDAMLPAEQVRAAAALASLSPERPIASIQCLVQSPGQRIAWEAWTFRLLPDEEYRLGEVQAVGQDITEYKYAQEERERLLVRAQTLLRISARLNAQLDEDAIVTTIGEEVAASLRVPFVYVARLEEDRTLRPLWSQGVPLEELPIIRPASNQRFRVSVGSAFRMSAEQFAQVPGAKRILERGIIALAGSMMEREQQPVGWIVAGRTADQQAFTDGELQLLRGLADQGAQALTNARLFADSQRQVRLLQTLRGIDVAILATADLTETLNVILTHISAILGVDAISILRLEPNGFTLSYLASSGFRSDAIAQTRLDVATTVAGRAVVSTDFVAVSDLRGEPGFYRAALLAGEDFHSYYAAPLRSGRQIQGVLEVFQRCPWTPSPTWTSMFETIAGQVAIAIEHSDLLCGLEDANASLERSYDATLEGWSRALDLRDDETHGHSTRVTSMSVMLAEALGLSPEEVLHIRRGALLHDIGKIGIPDAILLKPGKLDADEWVVMKRHPELAYNLLLGIEFLAPALDIPYCHHERWDGRGYPRGLAGEDIPLAARIFAVVDVWDALRSDRPYRKGWPDDRVYAHLREHAGSHFDPAVVEAFLQLVEAKGSAIDDEGVAV